LLADAPRVLIDGRSGSGKTELARAIVDARPEFQLVRLDDLYPGWDGLDEGSREVPSILEKLRWRAWDWQRAEPGDWHSLDAERPILIEGVGAVSRASRYLADAAVWVDLDAARRKRRALERDGDTFAPHWDQWAREELRFIRREEPRSLADLIVDGSDVSAVLPELLHFLDER
jgi:uridine kinase